MRRRSSKWIIIILMTFLLNTVVIQAIGEDLSIMSIEDKVQLAETLRLKKLFGSLIWPGFGEANIPLLLYNEKYEFLIGHPSPPAPWVSAKGESFQGNPYHRRTITEPQAFAVPVGDLWAGSLDALGHMNRSMKEQIQEKIPPEKLTPVMIKMMAISPAHHVVALLHEAFHAFQAIQAQDRFRQTQKLYTHQKLYPYEDEVFKDAWKEEGSLLASALKEQDESEKLETIARFLEVRSKRRSEASLSAELTTFERELEWLEGIAKYVELQFAMQGSSLQEEAEQRDYRVVRNRLQADFSFRLRNLGDLHGDQRFYLSGAAQAMILDTVSPGWKQNIMGRTNIGLEDLLERSFQDTGKPVKDIEEKPGVVLTEGMVHPGFDAPAVKDLGGKHRGLGKKGDPPFAI